MPSPLASAPASRSILILPTGKVGAVDGSIIVEVAGETFDNFKLHRIGEVSE